MTTLVIIGCIIVLFGAVAFRGAPYVPTLRRSVSNGLDLLRLEEDDLVVDLGSGDGNVLKAAAQRGYRALGYELNPVMCLVAKLRCLSYKKRVTVQWRDFWLAEWPHDAKAIFVFLAGPYMGHLARKLDHEMGKRSQPLQVVSNGFAIPGYLPKKISGGMYLYELQPNVPTPDAHPPHWNPRQEHRKLTQE
jgi:SAM-dependent methyltransferase